jgi:poly-gamma-glutamate synthesis protein (capsule biosynthesis protein)
MEPLLPVHDVIRLFAVGDICPGDHFCPGFGVGSLARRYGPSFPFRYVSPSFAGADVVFGNCEGVVSDVGADPGDIDTMEFRGDPSFATGFRAAGLNVMAIANNHVGEHGPDALWDTVKNLRSSGIDVIGLRDQNGTAAPLIKTVRGIKIGWLAYTWIVSNNTAQDRAILAWTRGDDVPSAVRALRSQVDFLIVSAHWGREFVSVPPQSVVDHAHSIVDAGADLLLGHHPHVLQGAELIGKSLVIYSLGNFIFDMWQARLRKTAIFRCTIGNDGILDWKFVPLIINKRFQPVPADKAQAAEILRLIEHRSVAIQDTEHAYIREHSAVAKAEGDFKRWLFRSQVFHLVRSVGRMGPRIAYQKLRRRASRISAMKRLARSLRSS